MIWLKDNTYWQHKYNTEKNNRETDEKMFMNTIRMFIRQTEELKARIKYLEDKNRLYRQKDKERKENERRKITKDNK